LALGAACQGPVDTIAASEGDYDPAHPPTLLPITGSLAAIDPSLFHWKDTYYVFSTGPGISLRSTKDLATFRDEPQVFKPNPSWIEATIPQVTDLWSPHVVAWGGTIHLYFAASTFSSAKSCIGHATTAGMDMPFVDQGWVICSNLTNVVDRWNAIDPAVFLDGPDPTPYLVFGSFEEGIKLIALNAKGGRADTQMVALAARPDSSAIQAPFLYQWRDNYYLFVSFDHCCNDANFPHTLRVGRSKTVQGPYVDREGKRMLDGGGTLLLASDNRFRSPGSNMVMDHAGRRLNVYTAYDAEKGGAATLRIAPLYFDNDGWPVPVGP
jgi:arabinan endo-1,5-alpha-L-arabinosidase